MKQETQGYIIGLRGLLAGHEMELESGVEEERAAPNDGGLSSSLVATSFVGRCI